MDANSLQNGSVLDAIQQREQTGNPYWHLTPKQIERYTPRSLNAKRAEQEHRDRIEAEEARAKAYYAGIKSD